MTKVELFNKFLEDSDATITICKLGKCYKTYKEAEKHVEEDVKFYKNILQFFHNDTYV